MRSKQIVFFNQLYYTLCLDSHIYVTIHEIWKKTMFFLCKQYFDKSYPWKGSLLHSNETLFKESYVRFTTVPLKLKFDQ